MIDIIKNIFDLMIDFINSIFFLEIELTNDTNVYLGVLVCSFVTFVLILYFILKALGVIDKGGDD